MIANRDPHPGVRSECNVCGGVANLRDSSDPVIAFDREDFDPENHLDQYGITRSAMVAALCRALESTGVDADRSVAQALLHHGWCVLHKRCWEETSFNRWDAEVPTGG